MIFKRKIQNYARSFAEYCGRNADYLPESGLWVFYNGTGTEKKTTDEMMKDYEKHDKSHEIILK
jgi:hypothetical protein